ncbi:diaminopimelate epimerase [Temperatibacter marinus]
MHGLGNDFVIFDARSCEFSMSNCKAKSLCHRKRGIGCDQLIILRQSKTADVFMEIWNADGTRVGACGNATRCIGHLIIEEKGQRRCTIETDADILKAEKANGLIKVTMGKAKILAQDVPLAKEMNTLSVDLDLYGLPAAVCTSMGNPHVTFFMDSIPDDHFLEKMGPKIETHSLFPEYVNVAFAFLQADGSLRLRVWERGAGVTEACGTAACAAGVAAYRRQITSRRSVIELDGGRLEIEYQSDGTVMMTGPIAYSFNGEVMIND